MERAREPEAALGARDARLSGAAAGLVAFGAVAALAFAHGGFEPTAWGWGALALAWVAAAALVLRDEVALTRLQLAQLAALAAFAAWVGLSALWSESVGLTLEEAKRPLIYLAAVAALAVWAGARVEWIAGGVAAAGAVVCAYNLASHRWPDALGESIYGFAGDFGAPIGYENAVGIVAALTLLLAGGLALRNAGPLRVAWLAAVLLAGAALSASESRGAWLALAAGAAAAVALRLPRPVPALAVAVLVGAAAVGVAAAFESEQRRAYWDTTLELVADGPLLGSGAGTWERGWLSERAEPFAAQDAHSLYLETLAELGPLGLALLLAALAPPLVAAVRAREQPLVPATAGGYVAFLLHAGVDWDWELPAVTIAGLTCGVAVLGASAAERVAVPRAALAPLAVVAALAAYGLAGSWAEASAAEALRSGDWGRAEQRAELASQLEPWSAAALRLRGVAQLSAGSEEAARGSLRDAVAEDPGDVEAWRALARVTSGEERERARERAELLDPLGGR